MAKTVKHEPRRFLRDFQILGECHAGDTFRMIRNHPNRHKPLAEREFRVLKDCADFDRKAVAAIAALEGFAVRKVINLVAPAMRAELAITPADRS
jgi:hypothetical protein